VVRWWRHATTEKSLRFPASKLSHLGEKDRPRQEVGNLATSRSKVEDDGCWSSPVPHSRFEVGLGDMAS
jgi:hypothetical protein